MALHARKEGHFQELIDVILSLDKGFLYSLSFRKGNNATDRFPNSVGNYHKNVQERLILELKWGHTIYTVGFDQLIGR